MKRHNQRGKLLVALLLALRLPILAACGGGQPAANAPDATPAPAASAPDATQAAPAADAPTAAPAAAAQATTAPADAQAGTAGAGGKLRIAASLGTWPDTIAPQK